MDVALTNSIVNTATSLASAKTSDALNMVVLKKALDMPEIPSRASTEFYSPLVAVTTPAALPGIAWSSETAITDASARPRWKKTAIGCRGSRTRLSRTIRPPASKTRE